MRTRLAPVIVELISKVRIAEQCLASAVAEIRKTCPHDLVYHQAGYNGTPLPDQFSGSRHHEMRTCCNCGLTEEGRWGCFEVLKTEAIIPVSYVASYRLPNAAERRATPAQSSAEQRPARETEDATVKSRDGGERG